MLTTATLGMVVYSLYSVLSALIDILWKSRVELWANLALIAFGALLLLSAAFVRVQIPGGLALAIGALLGLQALSVHADAHSEMGLMVLPQVIRGAIAAGLVALAYFGAGKTGEAGGGS